MTVETDNFKIEEVEDAQGRKGIVLSNKNENGELVFLKVHKNHTDSVETYMVIDKK